MASDSPTLSADVFLSPASASAAAALHANGHKALTPIISGAISGGCVALAWIIGFAIYFYKRHRREKRARALGFKSHREMLDPPKKPQDPYIIPPDPAIVEGKAVPGEQIIVQHKKHHHVFSTGSVPLTQEAQAAREARSAEEGESKPSLTDQRPETPQHATSLPQRTQSNGSAGSPSTAHDRQVPNSDVTLTSQSLPSRLDHTTS
ncbi:hypothetical protein K474DRAFT_1711595 [Panus rudis PR-1116 ss-1]|nr:hypothetical protein K474DRAFT_1711595 [Panus rudis PR-1116 ss-1]